MFQRLQLEKKIHLAASAEHVWSHLVTLQGLTKWLLDSGRHEPDQPEIDAGGTYDYRYGNVRNRGKVLQKVRNQTLILRNQYTLSFRDGETIDFPLKTTFRLLEGVQSEDSWLHVELEGFYGVHGTMLRDIFDFTYGKVLFNLKSVIELGLDLRLALFQETELGLEHLTDQRSIEGVIYQGNRITGVLPEGLGAELGVQVDDLLLRIGERAVPTYQELARVAGETVKQKNIEVEVLRESKRLVLHFYRENQEVRNHV